MSWRPTGSPSERPHGIEIPGRPAMLTGSVQASERYIATGSAILAPNGQATDGLVGRDEGVDARARRRRRSRP